MVSLWLCANPEGNDSHGWASLYSDSTDPFGPNEYAIAQGVPARSRLALATQREIRGRGIAMTTRTIIGQAQGIFGGAERAGACLDSELIHAECLINKHGPSVPERRQLGKAYAVAQTMASGCGNSAWRGHTRTGAADSGIVGSDIEGLRDWLIATIECNHSDLRAQDFGA
jgi:hypothetical protein